MAQQNQASPRTSRDEEPHQIQHRRLVPQSEAFRSETGASGLPRPLPGYAMAADYTSDASDAKVYQVRSGQTQSRVRGILNRTASYEVRLEAWSCSCPAFAFAAFPATVSEGGDTHKTMEEITYESDTNWRFGGLTLGNDMPVCKHLLVCALVEHSSVFSTFVEEKELSIEELVGWAAGWGD